MEIDFVENVLSGINEKTIDSISKERYKKMGKDDVKTQRVKNIGFSKKMIAAAAAAALFICSLAVIIPLSLRTPENAGKQNTVEPVNPQNPQYIENFTAPELQELYKTEPYSELLPNIIPRDLSFKSSFLTGADAVSNPDDRKFLAIIFDSDSNNLEIKISEYDGTGSVADPKKPETYKLELYYGPIENEGAVGASLPNVFVPINASDITKETASARIYTFKDGTCKAEIDIICDKHIVSYVYTGKPITGDLFFDCITSSLFFERLEKESENTSGQVAEGIPQYIPEYDAPALDEIYATVPYSELLPKRLLSGCSFVSSYMTKYDPVANPDDHKFLALVFKTGSEAWCTMEIKVSEYDETMPFADINDKKTYALSYLYGENAGPAENLQGFSELFHSKDISKDIVKDMVYTLSDGLCKAEISILCGDYIVSYAYTGPQITSDAFYDMIISTDYLEKYVETFSYFW